MAASCTVVTLLCGQTSSDRQINDWQSPQKLPLCEFPWQKLFPGTNSTMMRHTHAKTQWKHYQLAGNKPSKQPFCSVMNFTLERGFANHHHCVNMHFWERCTFNKSVFMGGEEDRGVEMEAKRVNKVRVERETESRDRFVTMGSDSKVWTRDGRFIAHHLSCPGCPSDLEGCRTST